MPLPTKRAHLALETPENTESSSGDESDSSSSEEEGGMNAGQLPQHGDHELQVEFEARTAEVNDYHGISRLLGQTFRGGTGDFIPALTDFVISQRFIGSVITQSRNQEEEDEDEEDEEFDDLQNEVFGMMTLIKLGGPNPHTASKAVSDYLQAILSDKSKDLALLNGILKNVENNVGFIISERIINIPAQISVPLYETLANEVKKATSKNLPFNFTHYVLISKILTSSNNSTSSSSNENIFINAEEEIVVPECDLTVDIKDKEPVYRSDWGSDNQLLEKRKILVFKAGKMDKIVNGLKSAFPIP